MTTKEKYSYIKGLAKGLNLNTETPEGQLISEMLKLMGKMTDEIEMLKDDVKELYEYVDELDHDLGDVESELFDCYDDDDDDDDDYDEFDDDDEECGCDCEDCFGCEDEELYEAECSNCGEMICFSPEIKEDEMICPACNKPFIETEDE